MRAGQRFSVDNAGDDSAAGPQVMLEWINRYGSSVDFVDPPHNAKVHFIGEGASLLRGGLIIASTE